MDIKELNSFNLSDAIKFHDQLNPKLWHNSKLDPAVKKQLLVIAADFMDELGIYDIDVEDITVSGSNAAFTYTPHSDLDLHILVDMSKLPNDEVYRELFQAKKTLYNDSHDITIHGVPVELYVQDTNQPVVSLGEYSILNDRWIKIPKKRKATLDQAATKAKYDTLSDLIKLAMKTHDSNRVSNVLKMIKRYRQAGLSKGGEFSPENLAFKIIRTQGAIDALYALRDKLHSEELTIEEKQLDSTPIRPTVEPDHLAERLSTEFKDYDLTEYRSQEIIHANPKINTLKSLARNNKHGSARFTIDKDGYLKAGDSVAFVHQDLEPAYGRVIIRGYINFHDGNYNYRTMGPHDNLPKDHPILRKFEKAGIENGNIDTNLNEALDRDGAIQQILKLKNTSGRTQGEIESATNIINKLMQKFNIRPEEIDKPKVTKLAKKIAATQYEKQAASDALKAEWERFKRGFFKEDAGTPAATNVSRIATELKKFARRLGVTAELRQLPEAYFPALELTDLYADKLGTGAGSKVMTELTRLADDAGLNVYLRPSNQENKAFYAKFGFVKDDKHFAMMVRYPTEEPDGENINLAMRKGAGAWERGWRGPESNKPKEIKPYDPERYKNVRLPYRDDDDDETNEDYDPVNETEDRKAAVLRIQKHLNNKYGANLDLDGKLGPLTLKSINKFMPRAKTGLADEPDKTTAVQGKKLKEASEYIPRPIKGRYAPYFIGANLSEGQKHLNSINGTVPMKVWLAEIETALHGNIITEVIDEDLLFKIQSLEKIAPNPKVGESYIPIPIILSMNTVYVQDISGSFPAESLPKFLKLVSKTENALIFKLGNEVLQYPQTVRHASSYATVLTAANVDQYEKIRMLVSLYFNQNLLPLPLNEASGYIPSQNEKNDPRFKTALTVDIKPDSIKKNAKAFNWKTSRAGIPPQANPNGKITEALISYSPDKKFVNEKEEVQYVATTVKDWRIRAKIFETIATRNINESTNNYQNIRERVMKSLVVFSTKKLKIGNNYIPVQINILRDSLLFYDVKGNSPAQEPAEFGTLVELSNDEAKIRINNKLYNYPIHIDSANLMMVTVFLDSEEKYDQLRMMVRLEFEQSLPPIKAAPEKS